MSDPMNDTNHTPGATPEAIALAKARVIDAKLHGAAALTRLLPDTTNADELNAAADALAAKLNLEPVNKVPSIDPAAMTPADRMTYALEQQTGDASNRLIGGPTRTALAGVGASIGDTSNLSAYEKLDRVVEAQTKALRR